MAIHVMENYVSVDEYAALCGIKRRSVLDRIKSKLISAIKVDGYLAINTATNLPQIIYMPVGKSREAVRMYRTPSCGVLLDGAGVKKFAVIPSCVPSLPVKWKVG